MDRTKFAERLRAASVAARDFARSYILEALPDEMLFRLRLNQSYDRNQLHPDERVYPEDSALNLAEKMPRCTEAEVEELVARLVQLGPKLRVAHYGKITKGGSATPPSGF